MLLLNTYGSWAGQLGQTILPASKGVSSACKALWSRYLPLLYQTITFHRLVDWLLQLPRVLLSYPRARQHPK